MRTEDSYVMLQEHPLMPFQMACGPSVGDHRNPFFGLGFGIYLGLQASVRRDPHGGEREVKKAATGNSSKTGLSIYADSIRQMSGVQDKHSSSSNNMVGA